MKSVIHDWNDERCARILQNCRQALALGARLILLEKVMPEKLETKARDRFIVLDDLKMLRGPGGRERTSIEFRALLAKGGFSMRRVVSAGRYNIIETLAE
jgi:hypothetical protein